jgi:tRNA(Ile)-lysidine synthetase-like protein
MKVVVEPGKYILAASGGVDSMVLLDLLKDAPGVELVVAHFNHQIRKTSDEDEKLVRAVAEGLNVPIEIGYGNLGEEASEETARRVRYQFLEDVKKKHNAEKIITAHHQDDLIETAIINLLRGSGSRGLVAISLNPGIARPLLATPKSELIRYAKEQRLAWREDETNQDQKYLRNRVRSLLGARLTPEIREALLVKIAKAEGLINKADEVFAELEPLVFDGSSINRQAFILLPNDISSELMLRWLRRQSLSVDRPSLNRLTIAAKTARPNTRHNVVGRLKLQVGAKKIFLTEA